MSTLKELFERRESVLQDLRVSQDNDEITLLQEALIPVNAMIAEHPHTKAAPLAIDAVAAALRLLAKGPAVTDVDGLKELANVLTQLQTVLAVAGDERALLLNDD